MLLASPIPLAWNANIVGRNGPKTRADFRGKWINYFTEASGLATIHQRFNSALIHDESPWKVKLPKLATGTVEMVSAPIWSPRLKCSHRLSHAGFSMRALNARPIEASFDSERRVEYRDVFGDGIHLAYQVSQRRTVQIDRLITIDRGASAVRGELRFEWLLTLPDNVVPRVHRSGAIGFTFGSDELAGFSIRPPRAWSVRNPKRKLPIRLEIQRVAPGRWLLSKVLDAGVAAQLQGAICLDDTLTAYPAPGTGAGTSDGWVSHTDFLGDTWAAIRGGAGNGHGDSDVNQRCATIGVFQFGTTYTEVLRSIFTFETASIPDDATVDSATFSVWGVGKADDLAISPKLVTVTASPAADDDLVNADFTTLGTTAKSDTITWAAFATSDYNVFTLNDMTVIALNGNTKLGLREDVYDRANVEPTPDFNNSESYFEINYADVTGTSNDPKLGVVYTPAAPPAGDSGGWWYFFNR